MNFESTGIAMREKFIGHPETIAKAMAQLDSDIILPMVNFIYADAMTVPMRHHKRKRIHKKWAKKYRKPDPMMIVYKPRSLLTSTWARTAPFAERG